MKMKTKEKDIPKGIRRYGKKKITYRRKHGKVEKIEWVVGLLILLIGTASGLTNINFNSCTNVSANNVKMNLTADILNSNITKCINITGVNVTLECNGHTIQGNGTIHYGIYVWNKSGLTYTNVKIQNCVLDKWLTAGIYLNDVYNNTISGITCKRGTRGIYLENADYNTITSCSCLNNTIEQIYLLTDANYNKIQHTTVQGVSIGVSPNVNYGVRSLGSLNNITNVTASKTTYGIVAGQNNLIEESTIYNCEEGIRIHGSNPTIANNTIKNCTSYGIYVVSSGATAYNNILNNSRNIWIPEDKSIKLNTSKSLERKICNTRSPCTCTGNYWAYPNGTGFSDTHTCDSKYAIINANGTTVGTDYCAIGYGCQRACLQWTNDTSVVDTGNVKGCTANHTIKINYTTTDPVRFVVHIERFKRNATFYECSYTCDYCTDIRITNGSDYCILNITGQAEYAGQTMTISEGTFIKKYPPSNLPTALVTLTITSIVVIVTYTLKRKTAGWT